MTPSIHETQLQLTRPLVTAKGTITTRDVIYVTIEDGGFTGFGEAAPLQAWGSESYAMCLEALQNACETGRAPAMPSARFAWECAMADLKAKESGVPLVEYWGGTGTTLPVNATLGSSPKEELLSQAQGRVDDGFQTIKVKVGALSPDEDFERVCALLQAQPTTQIRIDANGAWSVDTALNLLKRLQDFTREAELKNLEYVEQPVPVGDEEALKRRAVDARIRIKIAADESSVPVDRAMGLVRMRYVDVLVIKPMVVGDLKRLRTLVDLAEEQGLSWVFTSSIDSAIARTAVAHLALAYGCKHACGLATGAWIKDDLAELTIESGELHLPEGPGLGLVDLVLP